MMSNATISTYIILHVYSDYSLIYLLLAKKVIKISKKSKMKIFDKFEVDYFDIFEQEQIQIFRIL